MIWLASYPRSGNTFFRIVLSEVYGIESSTFHNEPGYPVDSDYATYPIVKTHLLPSQLVPSDPKIPAVYLVRDGRDTVVSMAHQRKTFQDPYSNLYMNMKEAILASKGTYFGGWSQNVTKWLKRVKVVIHFEDLIADPIGEVEKLRAVMDLPQPNMEKLPGFVDLKEKDYQYGTGTAHGFTESDREKQRNYFFRRGKAGGWKDEMPPEIEDLFWEKHGAVMLQMGYQRQQTSAPSLRLSTVPPKRKVLIEATKLSEQQVDGGKRYVEELLHGFERINIEWEDEFKIDLLVDGSIHPLEFGDYSRKARFMDWLFTTKFADFLLLVKRTFPGLWNRAKAVKDARIEKRNLIFGDYNLIHYTVPQHFSRIQENVPNILTVHDFSHTHFPEFHLEANIAMAEEGMRYFARRKNVDFIAISEATKNDLMAAHTVKKKSISLIYEACDFDKFYPVSNPDYLEPVKKKYSLPDGRYLLCLSTIEPRKNLGNTMKAFLEYAAEHPEEDLYLVVAGKKGWKYEDIFNKEIDTDRIVFTGYIDDKDIAAVYSGAAAFLYVSYYEGFGLPILEAMSCGVPVIYGNNSSMPEIAGEGGLPADPGDVQEIKAQIGRVVEDEAFRLALREKALERSKEFSWAKTARETIELYRKTASPASPEE